MDRTVKLSRRSIPVRIYTSRFWAGRAENADCCKLFWATVLSPLAVVMWLYINGPRFVVKGTKRAVDHALIEHTAMKADQLAAWWQRLGNVTIFGVAAACVLALLAFAAYGFYTNPVTTVIVIGSVAGSVALFVGVIWWLVDCNGERFFIAGIKAVKNRTCPRVEIEP